MGNQDKIARTSMASCTMVSNSTTTLAIICNAYAKIKSSFVGTLPTLVSPMRAKTVFFAKIKIPAVSAYADTADIVTPNDQLPLTIASILLTSTFLGAITMVVLLTLVMIPPATCTAPAK